MKIGVCALLPVLAVMAGCKPWVVRPLAKASDAPATQNAVAYVSRIWPAKVQAAAEAAAEPAVFLAGRGQRALVRGQGKVVRIDSASRTGLLMVDLPPYDGRADIAIQIGPVLRGTALRDSLEFIRFDEFVNQLEFARVANELNARVWDEVLSKLPRDGWNGRAVQFAGACERQADAGLPVVTPVRLQRVDAR